MENSTRRVVQYPNFFWAAYFRTISADALVSDSNFEKEQKKRGWTWVSESAQASVLLRVRRGRLQQADPARARSRVNRRFFKGGACFQGSDPWRFWGHQADAFFRWIAAPLRAAKESSRCCFQPNDLVVFVGMFSCSPGCRSRVKTRRHRAPEFCTHRTH